MTKGMEIEREVEICAPRETVFRYFTDSERFANWWGAGSQVEPRVGGAVKIRYPDGTTASGVFQEIVKPERVVFSYGYDAPGASIPPGGSTVTVTLAETPRGTRVTLRHTGLPCEEVKREHVQGWRYQMSLFSKVVTAEAHAGASAVADLWFGAWNENDDAKRRELLGKCATAEVTFHDNFGALCGYEDVAGQIAATKRFMPGLTVGRVGEAVQCQGHALVRWEIRDPQGNVKGTGTNAVTFAADGRIARVVGFWGA